MFKKNQINIKDIHCKSCKILIESEVNNLKGIKNIEVNYQNGKCWIEFNDQQISQEKIFETIKKLGYKVDLII